MSRGNGYALHLYQPTETADGGIDDDGGDVGETLAKHLADGGVVGGVAQVDDEVHHVVVVHPRFAKQCLDVLPHAVGLADYVARVYNAAFVVDAGCACR